MLNALLGLLTGLLLGGIVCTTGVASPVFGPGATGMRDGDQSVHHESRPDPERENLTAYLC